MNIMLFYAGHGQRAPCGLIIKLIIFVRTELDGNIKSAEHKLSALINNSCVRVRGAGCRRVVMVLLPFGPTQGRGLLNSHGFLFLNYRTYLVFQ